MDVLYYLVCREQKVKEKNSQFNVALYLDLALFLSAVRGLHWTK